MNYNIWYWIAEYPYETAMVIFLLIIGYFGYIEVSKFWHKPLYIYGDGWRIKRYVGRIIKIKNAKKFYAKTSETEDFEAYIKMSGQPRRKILLPRDALEVAKANKIVMKKKYVLWSKVDNAYILTDVQIKSYLLDLENVERLDFNKIDMIDQKATRSARASPTLIHSVYSMHNIPMDDYDEDDELVIKTGKDIYQVDSVGGYGSYKDLEEKFKLEQEKDDMEKKARLKKKEKKEDEYNIEID